jgi:hypothetical protein
VWLSLGRSLDVAGGKKYSSALREVLRERRCEGLRQTEDMLAIEIGDDEPGETPRRERRDSGS